MSSVALGQWQTTRSTSIENLFQAHGAVGGSTVGRRWATEELNHALVLRLASEFQGFCRDLHDEAVDVLVGIVPGGRPVQRVFSAAFRAARKLDRGNAEPGGLGTDFALFGFELWPALRARYPSRGAEWSAKLTSLNKARNALAHDDQAKLAAVVANGWPLTLTSVRRWRSALDGLAVGMDHVLGSHLRLLIGTAPW
ncbi:hypothetical protein ACOBQX_17080 [Actinokineospora sp. G85]|uniref:hypothetical protein n=1 Tax=Actinokineospora sp. G85 TaxID=3406626 RepID=UPI003C790A88